MFDSPGLMDFATGLVNSVLNLPDGQAKFFAEFKLQKNCEINSAHQSVLVSWNDIWASIYASFSLPKWQALKMTFWHPAASQTHKYKLKYEKLLTPPFTFPFTADSIKKCDSCPLNVCSGM